MNINFHKTRYTNCIYTKWIYSEISNRPTRRRSTTDWRQKQKHIETELCLRSTLRCWMADAMVMLCWHWRRLCVGRASSVVGVSVNSVYCMLVAVHSACRWKLYSIFQSAVRIARWQDDIAYTFRTSCTCTTRHTHAHIYQFTHSLTGPHSDGRHIVDQIISRYLLNRKRSFYYFFYPK